MAGPGRIRLGLQAKVLIPLIGFLVLIPAITLWFFNTQLQRQMETEARRTLATVEAVFLKSLEHRAQTSAAHYASIVAEARFKVTASLADRKTVEVLLGDLLEDAPESDEALLLYNEGGSLIGSRRRSAGLDLEALGQAVREAVREALTRAVAVRDVTVQGRAFNVLAIPVAGNEEDNRLGVLVVAVRLGDATVRELKLPRTEILFFSGTQVLASTLAGSPEEFSPGLPAPGPGAARAGDSAGDIREVVVGGEHFMARVGGLAPPGAARPGVSYVILSSYEQPLQALISIRRTLVEASILTVVVGALVIAWVVRRVTQPLRELRDTAEAVGRGDFSRRVGHYANDECGDLADSFNRMTTSLQSSRAELERTVDTLKNTQSQLIQSEKLSAVGQFVAGVAHELNNPLTAVIGFSELVSQTVADQKAKPQLEMIVKSAQRCHKIVQSLLGFARQHAPERRLLALDACLEEMLEIMAYDLRTSNIRVVRGFGAGLPPILGDAHLLQQVFINILSNARQAIQSFRRDGEVRIGTELDGGSIRLTFQDNGPGIRAEHLSRIFDPFFTTKPIGKGTGLGMSLSYGIIREHGGTIRVHSEHGRGATFVIELPVAEAGGAEAPARVAAAAAGPAASRAGKSVLVVDDEEAILALTSAVLREEGYGVETAASGAAALKRAAQRHFDVIVCDWKMPGLSGIQLFEHFCATDAAAASRMLFMTGDVVNDTFRDFLAQRAKICLTKPFAIEDFRVAVGSLIAAAG